MKNKILLGTFILGSGVSKNTIRNIVETFRCDNVFVFSFRDNDRDKFLATFNVDKSNIVAINDFKKIYKNTTQLHRNKSTNTIYTINSLNELIKQISKINEIDKNVKINWKDYQNCLIYLKDKKVNSVKIKLNQIIKI